MTPDLQRIAVTHICDLRAVALGATREAAEIAHNRDMRVAHLRSAKASIVRNICNRQEARETVCNVPANGPRVAMSASGHERSRAPQHQTTFCLRCAAASDAMGQSHLFALRKT